MSDALPIKFTDRDLARGRLLPPAWYRVRVDDVTTKLAQKGDSTNYNVEATVIHNADDGSTEAEHNGEKVETAGSVIFWNFNSKAPGFMQGYFRAFLPPDAKLTSNEVYDLKGTKGKELEVFVENGEWNGALVNRIQKYRAVREVREGK
jgi:hypothetical protein